MVQTYQAWPLIGQEGLSSESRTPLSCSVAYLYLHTTQEKIFEAEIAGFEDNNLENLFTEYFIFKHVTFICANGLICKNNFSMAQLKDYLLSILSWMKVLRCHRHKDKWKQVFNLNSCNCPKLWLWHSVHIVWILSKM